MTGVQSEESTAIRGDAEATASLSHQNRRRGLRLRDAVDHRYFVALGDAPSITTALIEENAHV